MNDPINIKLRRHQEGCHVTVRVSPEIEAFFQQWGGGAVVSANEYGTLWRKADDLKEIPLAWSLFTTDNGLVKYNMLKTGDNFSVLEPGLSKSSGKYKINLALLRLVGASQPDGVSFVYNGLLDEETISSLMSEFMQQGESFYRNYIRPFTLSAELRGA